MKIHKIILKDYLQFKDVEINLTYPAGHEKAGKPLDKVCIIGQSGTGKTTLLRLVKYWVTNNRSIGTDLSIDPTPLSKVKMVMGFGKYRYLKSRKGDSFNNSNVAGETTSEWVVSWRTARNSHIEKYKPQLINFPAERLVSKSPKGDQDNSTVGVQSAAQAREEYLENLELSQYIDFAIEDSSKGWDFVLSDLKKYQAKELVWKTKISEIALKKSTKPTDLDMALNEYKSWKEAHPDPLATLSLALDPLLCEFGVKIKTEVDLDSIMHLGSILLQTVEGKDIERDLWSTGTKQLVDTVVPLIESNPKYAIILIDEPEKSLYPDIQSKIVDFYTSLTTDCQFFYATHSPIIAASFDPWEIVELKWNDDHQSVYQETNYVGERHVDNYTVYPKYLRWDRILMNLFDLTEEGNSAERDKAILEILNLRAELQSLKAEGKAGTEDYRTKAERFFQLRKMVNWDEKTSQAD